MIRILLAILLLVVPSYAGAVGPVYPGTDASGVLVTPTGSTTASTLGNTALRIARVDDYGAAGNGITDDSGSFAAAIAAACPVGTPGVVTASPNKQYYSAHNITLQNCTLDMGVKSIEGLQIGFTPLVPAIQKAGAEFQFVSYTSNFAAGDVIYIGGSSATCTKSGPQSASYTGGTMGGTYATITAGTNFAIGSSQTISMQNLVAYLNGSSDPSIASNTYTLTTWPGAYNSTLQAVNILAIKSKSAGASGRTAWGFSTAASGSSALGSATLGTGSTGQPAYRNITGTGGCGALWGADTMKALNGVLSIAQSKTIVLLNGGAIQNGYVVSAASSFSQNDPASALTDVYGWVNNFNGITLSGTDTSVRNMGIFGFNTAIGTGGTIARATIEHIRLDSRNGIDLENDFDKSEIRDVIANNLVYGNAFVNQNINGISAPCVDLTPRNGNLINVSNGGSATKITDAFSYGHAGILVTGNEADIQAYGLGGDGPYLNITGILKLLDITVTAVGAGYTSQPTITVSPAIPGATFYANLVNGTITSISVVDPGEPASYLPPYTLANPTITITGGGGAGATATGTFIANRGTQTYGTNQNMNLVEVSPTILLTRNYFAKVQSVSSCCFGNIAEFVNPVDGGNTTPIFADNYSGLSIIGGSMGQINMTSTTRFARIVGVNLACMPTGGTQYPIMPNGLTYISAAGNINRSGSCAPDIVGDTGYSPPYVAAITPTSGQTITIATTNVTQLLTPASTLAALTISLPACTSSSIVSNVSVPTTQAITALTVNSPSGGSVIGAPSTLGLGGALSMTCLPGTGWVPSSNGSGGGGGGGGSGINALTGDVTATGSGSVAATLAAVGTAGSYGSATQIPVITTDGKGRVSGVATVAPSLGLSGLGLSNTILCNDGSPTPVAVACTLSGLNMGTSASGSASVVASAASVGALASISPSGTGGKLQINSVGLSSSALGFITFSGATSSATATRITQDGATANSTNCLNIGPNAAAAMIIRYSSIDLTSGGAVYGTLSGGIVLYVGASNSTTTTGGSTSVSSSVAVGTTPGTVNYAISADTTNGCLNITVTAPNSDNWHHQAMIQYSLVK